MKTWVIPAKTFLLGEYAAITGAPAIILTTSPGFKVALSEKPGLHDIHPNSPAGRWWLKQEIMHAGLQWHDPYQGCGGMGASSAQFLGAYLASTYIKKKIPTKEDMLAAYMQVAWRGNGLPPSGYDVIAQSQQGSVFIERRKNLLQSYSWPFKDLSVLLLHTGEKLATHEHLKNLKLPTDIKQLTAIVERAKLAFEMEESKGIVEAVNAYHQQLNTMNLVAAHSKQHIESFQKNPDILAVKGCGALGSDVILLLIHTQDEPAQRQILSQQGWKILATSQNLHYGALLL